MEFEFIQNEKMNLEGMKLLKMQKQNEECMKDNIKWAQTERKVKQIIG